MGYKKSKTNNKYFEDISPKQETISLTKQESDIIPRLQEIYRLKEKRKLLKEQQIETRRTIYNLSLEIEDKEESLYGSVIRRFSI